MTPEVAKNFLDTYIGASLNGPNAALDLRIPQANQYTNVLEDQAIAPVPRWGTDQGRGDAADLRRLAAADRPDRPRRTGHRICRKHRCPVRDLAGTGPGRSLLGGGPGRPLPATGGSARPTSGATRGERATPSCGRRCWSPCSSQVFPDDRVPRASPCPTSSWSRAASRTGDFIGLTNFSNLFFGADRTHFSWASSVRRRSSGWAGLPGLGTGLTGIGRSCATCGAGRGQRPSKSVGRAAGAVALIAMLWLVASTLLGSGGRPGTLIGHVHLRIVGTGLPVPHRSGPGDADHPAAARPALLPGRVSAAHDHHAGGHRVHVPDAHRHSAGRSHRSSSGRHVRLAVLGDPWGARLR